MACKKPKLNMLVFQFLLVLFTPKTRKRVFLFDRCSDSIEIKIKKKKSEKRLIYILKSLPLLRRQSLLLRRLKVVGLIKCTELKHVGERMVGEKSEKKSSVKEHDKIVFFV